MHHGSMPTTTELFDFESNYSGWTGRQEEDIRLRFGFGPARYFQLLHRAAATLEGQAHDPLTAHRVPRRVERATSRRAARSGIYPTF